MLIKNHNLLMHMIRGHELEVIIIYYCYIYIIINPKTKARAKYVRVIEVTQGLRKYNNNNRLQAPESKLGVILYEM